MYPYGTTDSTACKVRPNSHLHFSQIY